MEIVIFFVAIVALVALLLAESWLFDRLYEGRESYKTFREEHLGSAAINTVAVTGLISLFFGTAFLPAAALAGGTFVAWCVLRIFNRDNGKARIIWDKKDMRFLAGAFAVGIVAALLVAPLSVFWPVLILFAVAWVLQFPL